MIKIKKAGFSLSEALIALSVLGVLALLVLPGMIKDTTNKASIAHLQGTVGILNEAIQNEIMRTRATDLDDTRIVTDPVKFLETIDTVSISGNTTNFPLTGYKNLDGTAVTLYSTCTASAILRNGASICLSLNKGSGTNQGHIYIDVNGKRNPNIAGVDLFGLQLNKRRDYATSRNIGDLGGHTNLTIDSAKSGCQSGTDGENPIKCYTWLERSGFDSNYLNQK